MRLDGTPTEEDAVPTAFERTTTIAASPTQVWATLVDWEGAPRWMRGVERVSADGPPVPGTSITARTRGRDRPSRIVEVADGRRLVLRSAQGPVTADYAYAVQPDGDHTRVTLVATCEVRGVLALAAPLLRRVLARTDGDQLEDLRRVVEEDAPMG